jgi:predicted O-methyltransferase YrrM
MNKAFYDKVKTDMTGHLPGYYDSRQLIYDIILQSKPLPGSIHIEIGTLCGGGTMFMLKALQDKGTLDSEFVACIDPFTGFYEKEDTIVSMDTVKENVKRFGFDPERIIFFPTLSQDANTIEVLKGYTVNAVFIDGDHRYEAVAADWENCSRLVMKEGYVVLDDYVGEEEGRVKGSQNPKWRSTSWGQVSRFVDIDLLPKLRTLGFKFVKKSENAIAFKKVNKISFLEKFIGRW